MSEVKNWRNLIWLLVSVPVVILDQWTKSLAERHLQLFTPVDVVPHFNFTLMYNTGAAFSFLGNAGGWQRWFFVALAVLISVALCQWLLRLRPTQKWLSLALALIIAGALGNALDRVLLGHVIDFIDWYFGNYHWPAFNIADTGICIGAAILLLDSFFTKHSASTEPDTSVKNG